MSIFIRRPWVLFIGLIAFLFPLYSQAQLDPRVESVLNYAEGIYSYRPHLTESQATQVAEGYFVRTYSNGFQVRIATQPDGTQPEYKEANGNSWNTVGSFESWFARAQSRKEVVFVDGISFERTFLCNIIVCDDRPNYLTELFVDPATAASSGIHDFRWSGDPVMHFDEDLRAKFQNWFHASVCRVDEVCEVSFITHSWGTVIVSDFIANLAENTNVSIKSVITMGSPLSGLVNADGSSMSYRVALNKVFNQGGVWDNMVHPLDPIAWDIPGANNTTNDFSTPSAKGAHSQDFPLVGAQMEYWHFFNLLLELYVGVSPATFEEGEDYTSQLVNIVGLLASLGLGQDVFEDGDNNFNTLLDVWLGANGGPTQDSAAHLAQNYHPELVFPASLQRLAN